jgi:hypothetical protein
MHHSLTTLTDKILSGSLGKDMARTLLSCSLSFDLREFLKCHVPARTRAIPTKDKRVVLEYKSPGVRNVWSTKVPHFELAVRHLTTYEDNMKGAV